MGVRRTRATNHYPNASRFGWLFHVLSIEMADIPAAVGYFISGRPSGLPRRAFHAGGWLFTPSSVKRWFIVIDEVNQWSKRFGRHILDTVRNVATSTNRAGDVLTHPTPFLASSVSLVPAFSDLRP